MVWFSVGVTSFSVLEMSRNTSVAYLAFQSVDDAGSLNEVTAAER